MKLIKWNNEPVFSGLMQNFFDDNYNFLPARCGFSPAANIAETENGFELELAVPGIDKDNFKLSVENNVLTVSSEKEETKEQPEKNFTRKEFVYGSFSRSFTLPRSIDTDAISAAYTNGVLHVMLPKKEEAKAQPKKEITVA
ncbi:MAG: Hsp20/alpha crystallin family protein [Bacteroidota bacterium]